MSAPTDTPVPDPVEARLRAALEAEADRHPVTPGFDDLRTRADRAVVDLRLPPRRNRARILATAAVVALLAAAVAAVAIGAQDGEDEPLITEQPATGYYLPADGWTIQEVIPLPSFALPGAARTVEFAASSPGDEPVLDDLGTVTAFVSRIEGPAPDLMALTDAAGLEGARAVGRGQGDDAREYVVSGHTVEPGSEEPPPGEGGAEIESDGGSLSASVDDKVLVVDWYGPIGEAAIIDLADRWWTSGGEAIALDPATGLDRISDVTHPDPEPVSADELVTFGGLEDEEDPTALDDDVPMQVIVNVESPDGWQGSYTLLAPGTAVVTGAGEEDGGAGAGLGPDEVGAPLPASAGGPQPAWESGTGISADVPGASIGIARTSYLSDPLTAEQARELWAALAPAEHDAWVAAVDGIGLGFTDEVSWAPTLAATRLSDAASAEVPMEEPVLPELLPRDGVNPATGRPEDEVDRIVADALLAFAAGGEPIDADLFGPTTTFAFDEDGAPFDVPIEEVAGGPDPDAEASPPASEAWYVFQTLTPADLSDLLDEPGECPPLEALAAEPATVVVYQDYLGPEAGEEPCTSWGAVVVRLDAEQRIASVGSRYGDQ